MMSYVGMCGLAVTGGVALYTLWDRSVSNDSSRTIKAGDWLTPAGRYKANKSSPFTSQQIYDFSESFIETLKGVLAAPTPVKLGSLDTALRAPQTLHDDLWKDMAIRLARVVSSYETEYTAVVDTIIRFSEDTVQRHTALRLAQAGASVSRKLRDRADMLAQAQA